MKSWCYVTFMLSGILMPVAATADQIAPERMLRAAKLAVELCSACHGPRGDSTNPAFPKLAGQHAEYIEDQIKAFKGRSRAESEAHDFMWGMSALVDDSMIEPLGHYYETQPASKGRPGDATSIAKGEMIYRQGLPDRNIPACLTCHGQNGEGQGHFPRLAGQHAAYVVKQLKAIQAALRQAPVMHGIIKDLTEEEMKALAQYVQSR